jgi:hypothetical protein
MGAHALTQLHTTTWANPARPGANPSERGTADARRGRIEEILAVPITSPTVIANLYLAFHDQLAPH